MKMQSGGGVFLLVLTLVVCEVRSMGDKAPDLSAKTSYMANSAGHSVLGCSLGLQHYGVFVPPSLTL